MLWQLPLALITAWLSRPMPGNQFRLVLSGQSRDYAVEVSSNLNTWTPWTNVSITTGTVEVIDSAVPGNARRFYRAAPAPQSRRFLATVWSLK